MYFTNQEILFLISVSRGRELLGIETKMPVQEKREVFIKETIQSLIQKGILDKEERLTVEGADIVYLFEQYRNSPRHISLNDIYLAVLPEGKLIMAAPEAEGYDINLLEPEVLMLGILRSGEYLCHAEERAERGKWRDLNEELWKEEIEGMAGSILLREYSYGKKTDEKIYCWKDASGYLLNIKSKRVRELSSGVMRRQIYDMLGGNANGK